MNVIRRGKVGNYRNAGWKVVFSGIYLLVGIFLISLLAWTLIKGVYGAGAVGVILIMWTMALGDIEGGLLVSWLLDRE